MKKMMAVLALTCFYVNGADILADAQKQFNDSVKAAQEEQSRKAAAVTTEYIGKMREIDKIFAQRLEIAQNEATKNGDLAKVKQIDATKAALKLLEEKLTSVESENKPKSAGSDDKPKTAVNIETPKGKSQTITGKGTNTSEFFALKEGLVKFTSTYKGDGNFGVYLLNQQGENIELIANEIGTATCSKAIKIIQAGKYLFNVSGVGSWTIVIEQP